MKGKVFNIIVIVAISLLSAFTVYQGDVLRRTNWEPQTTKADLDELGAIVFAMGASDVELIESLDRQIEIWGMINSEMVWSVWQKLYWNDEEGYSDCLDRISTLHEELTNFETRWRERITHKKNLLDILEDKWGQDN